VSVATPPGTITLTRPTDRTLLLTATFFADDAGGGGRASAAALRHASLQVDDLARRGVALLNGGTLVNAAARVVTVFLAFDRDLPPLATPAVPS
jgi:hypothetical protein